MKVYAMTENQLKTKLENNNAKIDELLGKQDTCSCTRDFDGYDHMIGCYQEENKKILDELEIIYMF